MAQKPDNKLFNWYESNDKDMKQIVKKDTYDYSLTDIKPNSRVLICGSTGSGKTQTLLHYIRLSPNLFSKIMIFYKEKEELYTYLEKKMDKQNISFSSKLGDLPTLKKLRQDMEDEDRVLIILDDWVMELGDYPNINDYFIYGRKKNITIIILSQSFFDVPKILRQQMSYCLFHKMSMKRDIDLIISNYDTDSKQVRELYRDSTNVDLGFLKISCNENNANKKYSSGFSDFYSINQFL
jgi:energy-coupling factor transporter ATP-binding protein EcfA2